MMSLYRKLLLTESYWGVEKGFIKFLTLRYSTI